MKIFIVLLLFLFSFQLHAADLEGKSVLLRGVDKVTGRTRISEVEIGSPLTIGDIRITLERCLKAPPEETPENSAFLFIEEITGDVSNVIFNGWMFSSNPALSAMEHPIYDIWVLECLIPEDSENDWNNIEQTDKKAPKISNNIIVDELEDI